MPNNQAINKNQVNLSGKKMTTPQQQQQRALIIFSIVEPYEGAQNTSLIGPASLLDEHIMTKPRNWDEWEDLYAPMHRRKHSIGPFTDGKTLRWWLETGHRHNYPTILNLHHYLEVEKKLFHNAKEMEENIKVYYWIECCSHCQ